MNGTTDRDGSAPALEDWAGEMGARWLANLTRFEGMLAPIGTALLTQADYRPGERVLDIGCGGGATSLAIARSVAPAGRVLGIDLSHDLTEAATQRAAATGLDNVRFRCADAATVMLEEEPHDRLCSRFGSMFFAEPVAAFANLRRLLRPDARIDLAVWGPPPENPWMIEGMIVARRHIDLPPPVPRAPGPFAFEDRDYLTAILAGAGYGETVITPLTGQLAVGGPGATAVEAQAFVGSAMAFAQILHEQPAATRDAVVADLVSLYDRYYLPGEGVMMNYKVWLVSARA